MPGSFARDAYENDAIDLSFKGSASLPYVPFTVVVKDGILEMSATGVFRVVKVLKNYTIQSLVDEINSEWNPVAGGVSASVSSGIFSYGSTLLASTLMEGSMLVGSAGFTWPQFTSNNFALMMTIALVMKENIDNVHNALVQTDQHSATSEWLDYWGNVLGVPRLYSEITNDSYYRNRMQREAVLPKVNNNAMANIIEGAIGSATSVVDGGQPFLLVSPQDRVTTESKLPSIITGASLNAYELGPSTGAGTFIVRVSTTLTQDLYSYIYSMTSKYKPAGVSFTITNA
jgi:hypothetical protein